MDGVLHCSGRRLVYCFLLHVHDSWHLTVGHALGWRVEMRKAGSHGYVGGCGVGGLVVDRGGKLWHVPVAVQKIPHDTTLLLHGRSQTVSHVVGTTWNSP